MNYSAAIPTKLDVALQQHLLRADGQEDLCFVLWHPSQGAQRLTALVSEIVLPNAGDRNVHGNVAFLPEYVERVISEAIRKGAGIAFLHSHLGPGWQGMSPDDIRAEQLLATTVMGATGLPLVGMTLGTDGAWSARFWERLASRQYVCRWTDTVRVIGQAFRATFNHHRLSTLEQGPQLIRTSSAWGESKQADFARLRFGIVGAGSVGCLVAESLARMGVANINLIDFDSVEMGNLDRLLHAKRCDVGKSKVTVLANAIRQSATATTFAVQPSEYSVVETAGFQQALDCDILFSCVDRPWARFALNLVAYAHLIPVVDGGIAISTRSKRGLRNCSIRAHIAAPSRRCLECLGQYQAGLVAVERDGLLDDPRYIRGLPDDHVLRRRENVFGFSAIAASLEIMQMLSMVMEPSGISNHGAQVYHFVPGTIDRENLHECNHNCFFNTIVAKGDHAGLSCTGPHSAAVNARTARELSRSVKKPQRSWRIWLSRWFDSGKVC